VLRHLHRLVHCSSYVLARGVRRLLYETDGKWRRTRSGQSPPQRHLVAQRVGIVRYGERSAVLSCRLPIDCLVGIAIRLLCSHSYSTENLSESSLVEEWLSTHTGATGEKGMKDHLRRFATDEHSPWHLDAACQVSFPSDGRICNGAASALTVWIRCPRALCDNVSSSRPFPWLHTPLFVEISLHPDRSF